MNQVINIPEGFELKKVSETEYQIVPKKRKLPKTWKEFCEINSKPHDNECFITIDSNILNVTANNRLADTDKNVCPSKEVAEGILALIQLIQLRDYYNNGWKKGDNTFEECYVITCYLKTWLIGLPQDDKDYPFTFKSYNLAEEFLTNFRYLFDKVKYLY